MRLVFSSQVNHFPDGGDGRGLSTNLMARIESPLSINGDPPPRHSRLHPVRVGVTYELLVLEPQENTRGRVEDRRRYVCHLKVRYDRHGNVRLGNQTPD